ncbi:hypothetical protein OB953_19670 [Aeromonas salmonicida]|jgi:hypothetical protein|uniref:hypothetical protein n=1 Tax=Aeromonas salmonicida TaxID=645 RepID=UPI00259D8A78|nr:hypothetical protein [Aeromonas salmonicida]MDM5137794.1 hypothetical protein [Aeromonas salmonicida]
MNSNKILNSLNRATSIIANEKSRHDVLQEIDNAIQELTDLRRKVAGEAHGVGVGNSFGGDLGAQYRAGFEPMPD